VIEGALTSPAGRAGASVAGVLALTWSALKVFRALDLAFDEVYGTEPRTGLVAQLKDGLVVLATVGLGIVLMIGLGVLLGRSAAIALPYASLFGYVALVVGLVVVFLPFYYVMPPVDVSVREALPGTILLAVGWIVLQAGFQVYAANAGDYQGLRPAGRDPAVPHLALLRQHARPGGRGRQRRPRRAEPTGSADGRRRQHGRERLSAHRTTVTGTGDRRVTFSATLPSSTREAPSRP
jgi:hypothetical protein